MSIGPEYRYDLFISYAREDNHEHWVEELHLALGKELQQVLGREVNVFIDRSDLSNDYLRDLSEAIGDSNLFMPVLSPSYLTSESCMAEAERPALRSHSPIEPSGRIFPIVLIPTDYSGLLPHGLASIQHFSFWNDNEHSPVRLG